MGRKQSKHFHFKRTNGAYKKGMGSKQDQNPAQQVSPVVPRPTSGAHGIVMFSPKSLYSSTLMALLIAAHMASLLVCLCFIPAAFLGRHPIVLAFLNLWGLQCYLGFLRRSTHIALSGAPHRDSDPVALCLASQACL